LQRRRQQLRAQADVVIFRLHRARRDHHERHGMLLAVIEEGLQRRSIGHDGAAVALFAAQR
jgi:hypothetical protein